MSIGYDRAGDLMTATASAHDLARDWVMRMDAIARNLTDFLEAEDTRRVRARIEPGLHAYRGSTATSAATAIAALDGLWQDYLLLSRVVGEAADLAKRNFLQRHDSRIRALLEDASIRLPAVSIPVSRRGLLDPAETDARATPADVLRSMTDAFQEARDTIAAIAAAEASASSRMTALQAEAPQLASSLDAGTLTAISALGTMKNDPLGAVAMLTRIDGRLAQARAAQEAAAKTIADLRTALDQAHRDLATARSVLAASVDREAASGVAMDHGSIDSARGLADQAAWLDRLHAVLATGRTEAVVLGLDRWTTAFGSVTAAIAERDRNLNHLLTKHEATRGRWRALRVKGTALARKGVSGSGIAAAESAALAALARHPVEPDAARLAVDAYEATLAAAAKIQGAPP